MRKRAFMIVALLCLVGVGMSLVFAQNQLPPSTLNLVQSFGTAPPRSILYSVNTDQMVWVRPTGALELVDASTFTTQAVLYERGAYNAYIFSEDGQWLAVALETRIDIWDTNTGELSVRFEPQGALRVEGPLFFSPDGGLLMFNTQVRAPQELRRSENDTVNLPWVWDVGFAQRERRSTLPGLVEAQAFYDFRGGFVFTGGNRIIGGLPGRLNYLQLTSDETVSVQEITTTRNEQDPITAWRGAGNGAFYVETSAGLRQFDAETGNVIVVPTSELTFGRITQYESLVKAPFSTIIGDGSTVIENDLLRHWLGDDYATIRQTVSLIDVLTPATAQAQEQRIILLINDEYGATTFRTLNLGSDQRIAVHPFGIQVAIYRASANEIDLFDLPSGLHLRTISSAGILADAPFTYSADGNALIAGFQRFDTRSGELLIEQPDYLFTSASFTFASNSESLIFNRGNQWDVIDIVTEETMRVEKQMLRGTVLDADLTRGRFLTTLDDNQLAREIVDISSGERITIFFEGWRGRELYDIKHNEDWTYFLLIYSPTYDFYDRTGGLALFDRDGLLWRVEDTDLLPAPFDVTWYDPDTILLRGLDAGQEHLTERMYGVDYAPNGLPACMMEAILDAEERWAGIWESFAYFREPHELNRLALAICDALERERFDVTTIDPNATVNAILFPTMTPTRAPITATPSTIAGVPLCLTSRFPTEARDYAEDWRMLTEGLSEEEVINLEALLCESLQGEGGLNEIIVRTALPPVMLIDAATGTRYTGGELAFAAQPESRQTELLERVFRANGITMPTDIKISPDGRFIAGNRSNGVVVYSLVPDFDQLAAQVTATAEQFARAGQAQRISLLPQATEPFRMVGTPNPTLTPTVTPTFPPTPDATYVFTEREQVTEYCPYDSILSLESAPEGFALPGTMLVYLEREHQIGDYIARLDLNTGEWMIDDEIPLCAQVGCNVSPDGSWMLYRYQDVFISRRDGSQVSIFIPVNRTDEGVPEYFWTEDNLLYTVLAIADDATGERTFYVQLINPLDPDQVYEPILVPEAPTDFDGLTANIASAQPGLLARYAILRTPYRININRDGHKYYRYDMQTQALTYMARSEDPLEFQWSDNGDALYYRYPNDTTWLIFDTRDESTRIFGNLYTGLVSPDATRYASTYQLRPEQEKERRDAGLPIFRVEVSNRVTGAVHRYCVPGYEETPLGASLQWSPDGRYLLFFVVLPQDSVYSAPPRRMLALDTQTGAVVEVSQEVSTIEAWFIVEEGEGA